MNLNTLYEKYNSLNDIKQIGKEIVTEDYLCAVMGFYLCDRCLQLLLLEYSEKQVEYEKMQEERYCDSEQIITNRTNKQKESDGDFYSMTGMVKELSIDERAYPVTEGSSVRIRSLDDETMLMLLKFFEIGWQPQRIGEVDLESCSLCTITLEGEYTEMPEFRNDSKVIFKLRDDHKVQMIEQPIILEVDKDYQEKIFFTVKDTSEQHWIYINTISVYDIYAEIMSKFEDPKWIESFTKEELIQMKAATEKMILETCPNGKGFLCIEYESDCDQQINFYSKKWLESEPARKNRTTTFMARADKKTGKLGKRLRAALIEEPIALSTKIMEAELFSMYKIIEHKDQVL